MNETLRAFGGQVKSLGDGVFGGYGIVFSNADDPDLEDDFFTKSTDFWWNDFSTSVVTYDHAMGIHPSAIELNPDGTAQVDIDSVPPRRYKVGNVTKRLKDDYGVYFEFKLTDALAVYNEKLDIWEELMEQEHQAWLERVEQRLNSGFFNFSTDSIPQFTQRKHIKNGVHHITSWPIPGVAITHHAAEFRTRVNKLKTAPIASEDAALEAGQTDKQRVFDSSDYRRNPMLKLDAKALANTFALSHWEQIKALIDATKADEMPEETPTDSSKGALEEAMLPVAQQMASLLGIPEDEAMAAVMALAAQYLQGGAAPATEPEPMPDATSMYEEDPMMGKAAPLQFNASAFANAVASAQTGAAVHNPPQGAYMVNRQFNVNRGAQPVKSLSRTLRAIATKNHGAMKALGINPDTAGGYLVPTEQSNQIIELLRSKSLFLQGDASRLVSFYPMASDTLTIPKLTGGASVQWIGENAQITDNSPTFGQITLVAKKMATLIKVSNELLEDSDPDVDAIIREDMARAMAVEVDRVVLAGEGVGSVPRGLANIADVTKTALNAAPGYDNLVDMISRVEQADVESDDSWSWVFHPREKATLRKIKDSNNQYIWTGSDGIGQQMAGRVSELLLGYPYLTTTQIAIDTANNNETKMYFGRWRDVVVGMKKSIEIVASNEAGTSFEYDQTWIRAILRMDVNIRHAESIEILTDVRV